MFCDDKSIFLRMPSSHLDFLAHSNFGAFLFHGGPILRSYDLLLFNHFFALVCFIPSHIFTSLTHKFHVNLAIRFIFCINYVNITIVASRHHHTAIRRHMQIELIKNILRLINLTQLLFQIFCHVQHFARLILFSYVPYLDAQIIPRKQVIVVNRREFSPRNRIYYICKKVLSRWVVLDHEFC